MKKLILIILLIPFISNAQVFSSMALGYDTKGAGIANLAFGYDYKLINFQAEIRPSLTRKVEMNNLLGFRLSGNLINPDEDGLSIMPGVGYYFNHVSSDKRKLNTNVWAATLKSGIDITETGTLYIEGIYLKNDFQFSIGMQVNFR